MTEFDFGFRGYQPIWIEFKDVAPVATRLFEPLLGHTLVDVEGIVDGRGWNADWPLILKWSTSAIALMTKCSNLWAIDSWGGWQYDANYAGDEPHDPWRQVSVIGELGLSGLIGGGLEAVYARPFPAIGMFHLRLTQGSLILADGGDELSVAATDSRLPRAPAKEWIGREA